MGRLRSLEPRVQTLGAGRTQTITTQTQRITGSKLQRMRRELFAEQPLCVRCLAKGRVSEATERDHIVALANGGHDCRENVQGLCAACHRLKTQEDMRP